MSKFPATLALTSPHRRGEYVRRAQIVLNGANRLKRDFLKTEIDGDYGPLTQQATRNAQYWLGFPKRGINGIYGPALHSFLLPMTKVGARRLPPAFATRRAFRVRFARSQAAQAAKRARMVKLAASQIGTTESPDGSNRVKYSVWYNMIGPWCAMFCTWLGVAVGLKAFKRGSRWAYCPYIEDDAKNARHNLRLVSRSGAKAGDLALFNFGSGEAKHVGVVERVNLVAGTVTCIEGNTASGDGGSQDNGGGVYRRTRPLSHVRCFVRAKA